MVLGGGERHRVLAVAEHEQRGLLAGEELLDDDGAAGTPERAPEHPVDRRLGLGRGRRHHDALAGGEPVGLDHDRRAHAPQVVLGGRRGVEALIGGGRDVVGAAQILGEALRAFEPGGGAGRAERLDAGGFEGVDHAGDQRHLRADHHEVDRLRGAERDERRVVGRVEGDAFGIPGDAGIAGRAIEPVGQRACGELPGERVFAPTRTEKKNVHAPRRSERSRRRQWSQVGMLPSMAPQYGQRDAAHGLPWTAGRDLPRIGGHKDDRHGPARCVPL